MKLYSDSDIQDIADAIRSKNGSSDTYKVSQMATAISNIPSGGGSSLPEYGTLTYATWRPMSGSDINATMALQLFQMASPSYSVASDPCYFQVQHSSVSSQYSKVTTYFAKSTISSSDIGSNILNNLVSQTINQYTAWHGKSFQTNTYIAENILVKWDSVQIPTSVSYSGKFVTFDIDGKITGVYNSGSDFCTALRNNSIDVSNGLGWVTTYNTGTATAFSLKFKGAQP